MVAVRMVSEGVDVPRLAVGVYATTISTPLFFAQAVGRFVVPGGAAARPPSSSDRPRPPRLRQRDGGGAPRTTSSTSPKKEGEEDPYAESEQEIDEANREQDEDTGEQEQFSLRALESEAVLTECCTTARVAGCRPTRGARRSRTPGEDAGAARTRPGAAVAQEAAGRRGRSRTAARSPTRPTSSNCPPSGGPSSRTGRCWSCASSSTPSSARTSTRAASRTA